MLYWINNIYYSFPIQLLVFHLRSNHLLIFIWIIFILFLSGNLGQKLGFQFLFLDPEYLGSVNFWSFFFLGFAFGGLTMSWNLTTYLLGAQYFPFLATLSRPFTKFSLNNTVIPIGILLYYLLQMVLFQSGFQDKDVYTIFLNGLGLIFGGFSVVLGYSVYFHYTNRDINYYQRFKKPPPNLVKSFAPGHRNVDLDYIKLDSSRWKVQTYLNESLQSRIVRSVAHYDSNLIKNIFKQNHLNALVIQLFSMLTLVMLGYLVDITYFRIPAGASLLILLSIVIAVIGAVSYWFSEWSVTVILILLFSLNYFTSFGILKQHNEVHGLDYNSTKATYSNQALKNLFNKKRVEKDKEATIKILNKWQSNLKPKNGPKKPKMVVLSVSGGGLKSALWTVKVIQEVDQILEGQFLNHTTLITGASGGMIGMAYMRELILQNKLGDSIDLYHPVHQEIITQDLLNSVAFSMVSQDLLVPLSKVKINGQSYTKDRGYIFEKQLNENTNNLLNKPLESYFKPEVNGLIPLMFINASIVNDARRLIISPQGISYMMAAPVGISDSNAVEIDAVDFSLLFQDQNASQLNFLSALRMNATYPYVLPNVDLPSKPGIEAMDAGILDNYGIQNATRFIQVFHDWIKQNTSGVILVQISVSDKFEEIRSSNRVGVVESWFNPIGIAGKVFTLQEFEQDNSIGFIFDLLGYDNFQVIRFIYHPTHPDQEASISFHMTQKEKEDVQNAFYFEANQKSLRQLVQILD